MRTAFGALLVMACAAPVSGQALGTVLLPTGTLRPCTATEGTHRVFVQGDRLQAAYDLLLKRSPSFAVAMDQVESSGMLRVRIGYRQHVMRSHERLLGEERAAAVFLADAVGYSTGYPQCHVRVVVFTEALEEELLRAGVPEEAVVLDLALVLAHEVFGHLVPFAEQGVTVWPTPCRDPDRRAAWRTTGCAVDRENLIRRELGVPERATYARVDGPLLCALPGQRCTRWKLSNPGRALAGVTFDAFTDEAAFLARRAPAMPLAPAPPVRSTPPTFAPAVPEPSPAAASAAAPGPRP